MNYDVLTDQQLIEQLTAKKISFDKEKIKREEMIKLLKDYDLKHPKNEQNNFEQYNHQQVIYKEEVSAVVKAGAIINIVFGVLISFFIITLIYTIPTIYFNATLLSGNGNYKMAAGILGLFCSLIGGILVLVG
ncbi:phage holin family protein [Candidatus Hepatoplasma crinochetorum]|uniref:phage holin family protein n=1 Tax=Candidatus Hepatoplasma crinochetorum TaxID=295596 RepID=UPI003F65DE49